MIGPHQTASVRMFVVNKVEVFDHPDIAENSYVIYKAIIHHLLKIFKIYMSKNLYFIDHKHTN